MQPSPARAKLPELAPVKPMLLTVVDVPDEFVNVTGHGVEVTPTETVGVKFRKGQLKISELDNAVPLTLIEAFWLEVEVAAVSAEVIVVPFAEPPLVGVKVTLMLHVAPCVRVPQLLPLMTKLLFAMLMVGVTVAPVRFCSVTGHAPELDP